LKLIKSLYGLATAPRWWCEHLATALIKIGLPRSQFDPCLFYGPSLLFCFYVDDGIICAPDQETVDAFISQLRSLGFELTQEESLCEYLGIKFERRADGSYELTQQGLIDKILVATDLQNSSSNHLPAAQLALGSDPNGPDMTEAWAYASIVGMLLYLSTNTRPDITYAVSQVARFNARPKQTHAVAVKTIVRYLRGTKTKGTIIKPSDSLTLDLYVDADFAGLYKREPDNIPESVRSRTGYILLLAGCPLLWKSQLQTEISMSTLEAEYSALSQALRTLLPIRRILIEAASSVGLSGDMQASIQARTFEDNQGAYYLAVNQRLTNRTKYFLVKFHWFWSHHQQGEFTIFKVDTGDQLADFLTKGLPRETFERNRLAVQGW
jgi:hypothetical protein